MITAGPFAALDFGISECPIVLVDNEGRTLASVHKTTLTPSGGIGRLDAKANAALFASSPALLRAAIDYLMNQTQENAEALLCAVAASFGFEGDVPFVAVDQRMHDFCRDSVPAEGLPRVLSSMEWGL